MVVFCCYDSDVFELAKKPPTNWRIVKELGVFKFYEIVAVTMIEDWFLADVDGLAKYLKLQRAPKLKGRDAFEKIKFLFKAGNKIYRKGSSAHKFIESLDITTIRSSHRKELRKLEEELNFTKKP